jgi:hypothetical protein
LAVLGGLEAEGIQLVNEADESTAGPASFIETPFSSTSMSEPLRGHELAVWPRASEAAGPPPETIRQTPPLWPDRAGKADNRTDLRHIDSRFVRSDSRCSIASRLSVALAAYLFAIGKLEIVSLKWR